MTNFQLRIIDILNGDDELTAEEQEQVEDFKKRGIVVIEER